uniref:amidohydrolase family protein n=1 Tax=Roseibium sp. TaxID=1936156 RepID=UPI003D0C3383
MKRLFLIAAFSVFASTTLAQDKPPQTLITNVHIFDGVSEQRTENASVLIEGNRIKTISTDAISADSATVIDGGGRTLMPGLADTHVHLAFASLHQLQF